MERIWPHLPPGIKRQLGPLLPDIILAYLSPDEDNLVKVLTKLSGKFPDLPQDPARVVQEIAESAGTLVGIKKSATPTIQLLKEYGVMDEYGIGEKFEKKGLIEVADR